MKKRVIALTMAESDLLNPDGTLKVMQENWKNTKNGTQATLHSIRGGR